MDLLIIEDFAERESKVLTSLNQLSASLSPLPSEQLQATFSTIRKELVSLSTELASIQSLQKLSNSSSTSVDLRIDHYTESIQKMKDLFKSTVESMKDTRQRQAKVSLIGSSKGSKKYDFENEADANKKVTQSLRNLLRMVTAEASRSAESTKKMHDSSRVLAMTHKEFTGFGKLLHESKEILRSLTIKDKKDFIIVVLAFVIFVMAVLYVMKTRIIRLFSLGYF